MTHPAERTIQDVIAAIQLQDVRLQELSAKTRVREIKNIQNPNVSISHGAKVIHRLGDGFIVGAKLTARVDQENKTPSEPAVLIAVTLAITYSLLDAATYSDDVLEEFARTNGVFNAWPYWREYVQTTSSRMNLPPMVLPVFRVPRKPEAPEPTSRPSLPMGRKGASGRKKR